MLTRASFVITGNEMGAKEIRRTYGIYPDRIKIIPFFTPPSIVNYSLKSKLPKLDNLPNKYIYYPAQFWSHKNHFNLIQSLKIYQEKYDKQLHLVLSGADKGNLQYIRKVVKKCGLEDCVHFLGFLSFEDMVATYQYAEALVYVSFLGPNNIPPLEAMALGCPVLVSDFEGHRQQFEDSVLYINPMNPKDIADGLNIMLSSDRIRNELIFKGKNLAKSHTVEKYLFSMQEVFDELSIYRRCWKNSEICDE